jgi:hypothetical protein
MLINLLIDTETGEVHASLPKGMSTLRIYNLLNIFLISYIKRNIPKLRKELNKINS